MQERLACAPAAVNSGPHLIDPKAQKRFGRDTLTCALRYPAQRRRSSELAAGDCSCSSYIAAVALDLDLANLVLGTLGVTYPAASSPLSVSAPSDFGVVWGLIPRLRTSPHIKAEIARLAIVTAGHKRSSSSRQSADVFKLAHNRAILLDSMHQHLHTKNNRGKSPLSVNYDKSSQSHYQGSQAFLTWANKS